MAKFYVYACEVERNYGGSEEGGWWYDSYLRIAYRRLRHRRDTKRFLREMKEKYADRAWGDISSVRGGMEIQVFVSKGIPPKLTPTFKPHYE